MPVGRDGKYYNPYLQDFIAKKTERGKQDYRQGERSIYQAPSPSFSAPAPMQASVPFSQRVPQGANPQFLQDHPWVATGLNAWKSAISPIEGLFTETTPGQMINRTFDQAGNVATFGASHALQSQRHAKPYEPVSTGNDFMDKTSDVLGAGIGMVTGNPGMPSMSPLGRPHSIAQVVSPALGKAAAPLSNGAGRMGDFLRAKAEQNVLARATTNTMDFVGKTAAKAIPSNPYAAQVASGAARIGAFGMAEQVGEGAFTPNIQNRNVGQEIGASLRQGTGETAAMYGDAAEWLGNKTGSSLLQEGAKGLHSYGEEIQKGYEQDNVEFDGWKTLINPEFYSRNVTKTLPTMLSMVPATIAASYAGAGAATLAGVGTFGRVVMASAFGGVTGGSMEAAMEAGGTYKEAMQQAQSQGMDEVSAQTYADSAANDTWGKNFALLSATNALQLRNALAPFRAVEKAALKATGRIGGSALLEGGQEVAQQAIQDSSLGREFNMDANAWEQFTIGAILGGGSTAVGMAADPFTSVQEKTLNKLSPEIRKQANVMIETMKTQGMSEQEARIKVLDSLAETDQGKAIIQEAVQEFSNDATVQEQNNTPENLDGIQEAAKIVNTLDVKEPTELTNQLIRLSNEDLTRRINNAEAYAKSGEPNSMLDALYAEENRRQSGGNRVVDPKPKTKLDLAQEALQKFSGVVDPRILSHQLRVGLPQANALLDQLQESGVVGPRGENMKREILQSNVPQELSPKLEQAKQIMVEKGVTNPAVLSNLLKLDYKKTRSLLDELQNQGFISPPNKAGKREVIGSPSRRPAQIEQSPIQAEEESIDTSLQEEIAQVEDLITRKEKSLASDLKKQDKEISPETIRRSVMKRGGISTADVKGEMKAIPAAFKNSKGIPLDEMADEFGLSERELIDLLKGKKIERNYEGKAQDLLTNDEEYKALKQTLDLLREGAGTNVAEEQIALESSGAVPEAEEEEGAEQPEVEPEQIAAEPVQNEEKAEQKPELKAELEITDDRIIFRFDKANAEMSHYMRKNGFKLNNETGNKYWYAPKTHTNFEVAEKLTGRDFSQEKTEQYRKNHLAQTGKEFQGPFQPKPKPKYEPTEQELREVLGAIVKHSDRLSMINSLSQEFPDRKYKYDAYKDIRDELITRGWIDEKEKVLKPEEAIVKETESTTLEQLANPNFLEGKRLEDLNKYADQVGVQKKIGNMSEKKTRIQAAAEVRQEITNMDLNEFDLSQAKDLLRKVNLKVSGKLPELIQRLTDWRDNAGTDKFDESSFEQGEQQEVKSTSLQKHEELLQRAKETPGGEPSAETTVEPQTEEQPNQEQPAQEETKTPAAAKRNVSLLNRAQIDAIRMNVEGYATKNVDRKWEEIYENGNRDTFVKDSNGRFFLFQEDGSITSFPGKPKDITLTQTVEHMNRRAFEHPTKEVKPPAAANVDDLTLLDRVFRFEKRVEKGEVDSADEIKQFYQYLTMNSDAFKEELVAKLKTLDKYKKKRAATLQDLAEQTVDRIITGMALADGSGGIMLSFDGNQDKVIADKINGLTDEKLQARNKKIHDRVQEAKKSIENPETISELLFKKSRVGLSDEEQVKLDELQAVRTKEADKEKKQAVAAVSGEIEFGPVEPYTHTRTGEKMFKVTLKSRLDKDAYTALNKRMKDQGHPGYSSFAKGFLFKTDPTEYLKQFTEGLEDAVEPQESLEDIETAGRKKQAEKLRVVANSTIESANETLNRDRKTNTAKRSREAASAEESAQADIRFGKIMLNIADAIETGEATHLDGVKTKTHVETLAYYLRHAKREYEQKNNINYVGSQKREVSQEDIKVVEFPKAEVRDHSLKELISHVGEMAGAKNAVRAIKKLIDRSDGYVDVTNYMDELDKLMDVGKNVVKAKYYIAQIKDSLAPRKRLLAMGIKTDAQLRSALREYFTHRDGTAMSAEQRKELELKQKEREMGQLKIEGYFPTPKPLIDTMLEHAQIEDGMAVLEPSAGKGNIADEIHKEHPEANLEVVEYNNSLSTFLKDKGYNVVGSDFLELTGHYDRIIMNPPFEKLQDVEHVRHAYELLKPGGRIVAITSASPFFQQTKKAEDFREWLDELGADYSQNPEGSFKNADRSTGVNTYMVVIDKPGEAQHKKERTDMDTLISQAPPQWQRLYKEQITKASRLPNNEYDLSKPLPLYHGSKFANLTSLQDGTWFTPDKEFADIFAKYKSTNKKKDVPTVYEKTVDLRDYNLLDISDLSMGDVYPIRILADVFGVTTKELQEAYGTEDIDSPVALRNLIDMPQVTELLKSHGYAGIQAKESPNREKGFVPTFKLYKDIALKETDPDLKMIDEIASVVKEPYEMTSDEYYVPGNGHIASSVTEEGIKFVKNVRHHRQHVSKALIEGKTVPSNVLAEYPGIEEEVAKAIQNSKDYKAKQAERKAANEEFDRKVKEEKAKEKADAEAARNADIDARAAKSKNFDENVLWTKTKAEYVGKRRGFDKGLLSNDHYESVKAAVEAGKPVTEEVLKDYPDLQAVSKGAEKPNSLREHELRMQKAKEKKAKETVQLHSGFNPFATVKPIAPTGPASEYAFEDPEIERRFIGSVLEKQTLWSKFREKISDIRRAFTRQYVHLPRGAEFEPLRFALTRLQSQKGVASQRTIDFLKAITNNLRKSVV